MSQCVKPDNIPLDRTYKEGGSRKGEGRSTRGVSKTRVHQGKPLPTCHAEAASLLRFHKPVGIERGMMATTNGSDAPKLFARQASGLIRQFGFKDVFVFNTLGYALGLVLAVTPFLAGSVFPGRNVLMVSTIGTIMAAFNG